MPLKNDNESFYNNYTKLIKSIGKVMKKYKKESYVTCSNYYTITVFFIDGSTKTIDEDGIFESKGMQEIADTFLRLIPEGKEYPCLLEDGPKRLCELF